MFFPAYTLLAIIAGLRYGSAVDTYEGGKSPDSASGSERFCNSSAVLNFTTTCLMCSINNYTLCPEDSVKVTTGIGVSCSYTMQLDRFNVKRQGCQHICRMETAVLECCKGRWGDDCQECPGGASNPCNGHGVCSEGINGNGTCICQPEYAGTACEVCSPGRYGPSCAEECLCDRGTCNDGINGDGSCDCYSGYKGRFCDQALEGCKSIVCPEFSRCVESSNAGPTCQCLHGFEMVGLRCQAINPCEEIPGPCDPSAICMQTGAGAFHCKCQWGYEGDGFVCTPIDPCQVNYGSCPEDTTLCVYDQPGTSHCVCRDGYQNYVEGVGCELIDMCALNTTQCHRNANCTTVAPGVAVCICKEGYVGDGLECFGTIIERVQDLMVDGDLKGQFSYALTLLKFAYLEAFTVHGPFTIFLPTDDGFQSSLNTYQKNTMMSDANYARHLLRQHIIARQLTVEEMNNASTLYTLQGTTARLYYKRGELSYRLHGFTGRARVLHKDIVAVNGIIHIVDKLLDKPPVITGSSKRSIMEVLSSDKVYDQLEVLMESNGIADFLKDGGPWTVFAPSNAAWNNLPEGTVDYLLSEEGQEKLKALLRNHIVQPPVMTAAELVNTHRFLSIGHTATTVAVTAYGQIRLNGQVNVTQSDIHAYNGYIHHIDGILLPEALKPILPHRCDLYSYRLIRGTCGPCGSKLNCPGKDSVPVGRRERGCRFWVNLGKEHGGYKPLIGCRDMCNKTYTVPRCCDNFYGPQCQPCPGGFQNPCYGRGKCFDGFHGSGYCSCDNLYYGTTCEFCSDPTKYGPGCNQTCKCLYGRCDNRLTGSNGNCQPNTCYRGYVGLNCDVQQKKCSGWLRCHAHAECVKMSPKKIKGILDQLPRAFSRKKLRKLRKSVAYCQCKQGYTGSGSHCVEIDPCQTDDRGGCHPQALCIKTSPGLSRCKCDEGFVGDGFYCYPSTTCNSSLDCHDHAKCMYAGPGQSQCVCQDGYHGNGTHCVMNDICQKDNGGCYPEAKCTATGPGQANCTCPEGLGGDGYSCFGDLTYELKKHQQLKTFHQLMERIPREDNPLSDLDTNFTLLAPEDSALNRFIQSAPDNFFEDEDNLLLLSGYHLLPEAVAFEDLKTLYSGKELYTLTDDSHFSVNITASGGDVFINGAKIIQSDIVALNGYIHIIDQVLEPYPISNVPQTLEQLLEIKPDFSTSLQYLKKFDMISTLESMESYTLFVPVNSAWGSYKGSVTRSLLQYLVVPTMMMTWEMISKQQSVYSILDNNPGHKLTFTGEVHGQVFINNVPLVMTRSNMLTMRGVVHTISNLPPVDLAHCIVLQDDTKVGICGDCDQSLACPEGYSPMSADPVIVEGNCTYNITRLIRQEVPGCQQLCHRTIQVDECCPGYYGPTCNECPGGADDPCSGHGNCTDGSRGSGSCICHDGYVGHACAECTTEECLNDPCLIRNGGCHEFASCSVFDDGLVVCDCLLGYTGDGYHCVPVCDVDNGYCPLGSTCVINGDGIVTCLCPDGQILDGSTCWSGSRSCDVDNGGCSQNAKCTDEDGVICHCNYGFVGNGTLCNQDMWTTLLSLAQTSTFADLIQDNAIHSEMVLDLSRLLQDLTQNLTVFVPINTGFDNMGLHVSELERYISKQWIGLYPSEQARSYQALDGSELVIVSAGDKKDTYMVNGVLTVDCNIPVTNGILHLLAGPFSVLPQAQKQLQKTSGMFSHVVGGILGTIIIILVLAFAVWKTKHKTRVLVDRLRRSTVSSFTFANFNADKFNFVRFKPAQPASTGGTSSDVDVREEDAADGSPAHEENSAIVGGSHSSFSNPVFGQCPAGEEEQLIFK